MHVSDLESPPSFFVSDFVGITALLLFQTLLDFFLFYANVLLLVSNASLVKQKQ